MATYLQVHRIVRRARKNTRLMAGVGLLPNTAPYAAREVCLDDKVALILTT